MMSIYSDKLAHVQQLCACEDPLAHYLGARYLGDFMSQNELTTKFIEVAP